MHKYEIYDVWMALKLSLKNFFSLILFLSLITVGLFFLATYNNIKIDDITIEKYTYVMIIAIFIIFLQSIIIYFAN